MLLEARGISKQFGQTIANDALSLKFDSGKIHAILGENGAGKTTFLNILFGLYEPNEGKIFLDEEEVKFRSPKDALSHGIYLVQQNFSLIENFSVAENLALSNGLSLERLNLREVVDKMNSSEQGMKFIIDPWTLVSKLPMNLRQLVEIQRGLLRGSNILLLDEPTSVLGPNEAEELGAVLRRLASEGKMIVLTSHKLSQVMKLCDDYVVMRRGRIVFSGKGADIRNASELVRYIFGGDVVIQLPEKKPSEQSNTLEVRELEVKDEKGRIVVEEVSLKLGKGQVLGVAGVAGNGQKQLAEALVGLARISKGDIRFEDVSIKGKTTGELRKDGVGYIPEEGALTGLVPDFTLAENLSLTTYDLSGSTILLDSSATKERATGIISSYSISPSSETASTRNLSGGNLQKMIVGRELSRPLKLLVAYNPTKGLDIRTTILVQQKILERRNAGSVVVLVSEDLEEIMQLSDMIAVMFGGRVVGVKETKELNIQELGRLMSGGLTGREGN